MFESVLYENKESCCGCTACSMICSQNAITMIKDEEGFFYPKINQNLCTQCKLCEKVCHFKKKHIFSLPIESYAVKHKCESIRIKSQSGGIFSALSDYILHQNGVIYGSIINDVFLAEHTRAININERNRMRGSKYIESNLKNIFSNVKKDLDSDKLVLFTGTPCQIAGLKTYLKISYDNLLCMDIICHGIPSPHVWQSYLNYLSRKYKLKIKDVNFRNKELFDWGEHIETITFENGKVYESRTFANMYYSHLILRPSCFNCAYKQIGHPGDITVGDCWGIEKLNSDFADTKGVSLVLINTKKGKDFFNKIICDIDYFSVDVFDCIQPPLMCNYEKPDFKEQFWLDYQNKPFSYCIKKYGKESHKIRKFISRKKQKIIKKMRIKI